MILNLEGYPFRHICNIQPEKDSSGTVRAFFPHRELQTDLPLLPYGAGPFCRFQIPNDIPDAGVYAITIEHNRVFYIGETIHLSQRYNQGYGSIQPRNCFRGGQSTNLRLNSFIYHALFAGIDVDLWFYATSSYKIVEAQLIQHLQPTWNRQGIWQRRSDPFIQKPATNRFVTRPHESPATVGQPRTCREEIMICVRQIVERSGHNEFTVDEVLRAMHARGTRYKDSTIRTHVTAHMCSNAQQLREFQRTQHGMYRLRVEMTT